MDPNQWRSPPHSATEARGNQEQMAEPLARSLVASLRQESAESRPLHLTNWTGSSAGARTNRPVLHRGKVQLPFTGSATSAQSLSFLHLGVKT